MDMKSLKAFEKRRHRKTQKKPSTDLIMPCHIGFLIQYTCVPHEHVAALIVRKCIHSLPFSHGVPDSSGYPSALHTKNQYSLMLLMLLYDVISAIQHMEAISYR